MRRARFLAGAAVLMAACALPSTAMAQLGACPAIQPPPCIIIDATKIAQQVSEIKTKTQEVQKLVQQAQELTNIQGIMGRLKAPGLGSYGAISPVAPLPETTISAASEAFTATFPKGAMTQSTITGASAEGKTRLRSAAGDGFAIAQVIKARLAEISKNASDLQSLSGNVSKDLRADWQVNTQAKSLLLRAFAALKEVEAARAQLMGVSIFVNPMVANAPNIAHGAAATLPNAIAPGYAEKLGEISNLSNQLAALVTAKQLAASYADAIQGHRETQAEYQQILQAAKQAQTAVEQKAAQEARRKGKSAASLLATADKIMAQRDRTTWDDPNKANSAKSAADYAENQLDKMVSGDVGDSWSDYLRTRAEAYKQEAFFRSINADAKAFEADAIAAMNQHSELVGVQISNAAELDRAIASVQAKLADVGKSLENAPAEVKSQRDAIYSSTMAGTDYTGVPVEGTI